MQTTTKVAHKNVDGNHDECSSGACVETMDLCCGGHVEGVCHACDLERLNTAVDFARSETQRAVWAKADADRALAEFAHSTILRREIYDLLVAKGYHKGSYRDIMEPQSTNYAVSGGKYGSEYKFIKGVILHLLARIEGGKTEISV